MSCISVNDLNRLGAFVGPREFPFLGLRTAPHLIEYRGPKWPIDRPPQRIPIQWTRCNYGRKRPWLTCLCGRRVGKLYRGSVCLACRQCAEATYESQKNHDGADYSIRRRALELTWVILADPVSIPSRLDQAGCRGKSTAVLRCVQK